MLKDARSVFAASIAVPVMAALLWTEARGENRFALPELTLPAGAEDQTILVTCEHDVLVTAYSLSILVNPNLLRVTDVTVDGTSAADADFRDGDVDGQWISYGVLFDISPPVTRYLEPSSNHTLLRITFDVLAAAGATIPLTFADQLDVEPFGMNVLTDPDGKSVSSLELSDGQITVTAAGTQLAPIANAGGDTTIVESGETELDGSASFSPQGLPLTYSWVQLPGGPPAFDLSAANTATPRVRAPSVAADADMVFRLNVSDGTRSSFDDVKVTVIDLDARTVVISPPSGEGLGLIDDGARAVLWSSQIQWDTEVEDGYWRFVRFVGAGDGNEASLLSGVSLYIDANGDDTFGPEDTLAKGPVELAGDNAPLLLEITEFLEQGSSKTFFLVGDVAGASPPAEAGLMLPVLLALATAALGFRRRKALLAVAALAIVLLPLGMTACSSSDDGAPSREVQFDLTDVGIQGATSGIFMPTSGLPITGFPIEV